MPSLMELVQAAEQTPSDYFSTLFSLRDTLHLTHAYQPGRDLATHTALGELYNAILPVIDGILEGYMGVHLVALPLKVSGYTITDAKEIEPYVRSKYEYIRNYAGMFSESWIGSEIDLILKCMAITLYKLNYVK